MRTTICSRCWALVVIAFVLASIAPASGAQRYLARSWQSEDGLPSNVTRDVVQAADGYLWVGTAEGVVRFDGQRFTALRSSPGKKLESQSVRALYPLANGEVWVATTAGTVLRGQGSWLEEVALPPIPEGAPARVISRILQLQTGEIAVAHGNEVWLVNRSNRVRLAEQTPELNALTQQAETADPEQGRPVQGASGIRLRGVRGELWEFTSEAGLKVTDAAGRAESVPIQPETPSGARAMVQDREGNLWLATHSQGLWRLKPARVDMLTMADGLSDRATLLVSEDQAGALWIAPQSGGLDRLADGKVEHFEVGGGTIIRPLSALLQTRASVLWVATREGQAHRLDGDQFTLPFRSDGPGKILAMIEDDAGQIWFGGRFGLSVWDGNTPRRTIDLGSAESISSLASAGGIIWAGTESGRLFRGEGERFASAGTAETFGHYPISALLPDSDGSLWVSSLGAGLFQWRDGRAIPLASRMSEADPRITCVLDDGAGFLWMGTLGGICRAEKTKLLAASASAIDPIVVLDRSDGMLTRECTRSGQPAGWRGRDGTLYFSTGNGIARVRPEGITLNRVAPPVVIEGAAVGPNALAPGAAIARGGPGRSRVELRFTALSFTSPQKVRFRVRLEGLDETWRETGEQRTVTYEAVPPGIYRFHVMAENGDGIWNEKGASLAIEVLPHFWETRWFRISAALLAAVLAIGIGALVMQARLRGRLLRMEAQTSREKERARIAQDLHDDLGASLTEISLLANLAAEERQSAHAEDDTLPEVAAKAQGLVGALDEIVWAVNPRHDSLRSLAEYLAAFGGKFLGRAGMAFRRDVPRDLPEVNLDAERRHNIFLAAREALNNAVKHSGATEVWLRVRLEGANLNLFIEDNGRGFAAEGDELREGLRSMRKRMLRVGGTCRIESKATGTGVCLSLPLPMGKT